MIIRISTRFTQLSFIIVICILYCLIAALSASISAMSIFFACCGIFKYSGFDVFSRETGTTPDRELYRFFDKEGNTLVLRPDFTPSIARCAAKYFGEEHIPLRFSYLGSTFINTSSLQGKLKESTQMGAELIGDPSVEADAEIISLVVKSL